MLYSFEYIWIPFCTIGVTCNWSSFVKRIFGFVHFSHIPYVVVLQKICKTLQCVKSTVTLLRSINCLQKSTLSTLRVYIEVSLGYILHKIGFVGRPCVQGLHTHPSVFLPLCENTSSECTCACVCALKRHLFPSHHICISSQWEVTLPLVRVNLSYQLLIISNHTLT